ncbi:hypothetical protein M3J09_002082 [Ascochyta lentis]
MPKQHRQDVVLAYRVRIGMISRSSFVCASCAAPPRRTNHSSDSSPAAAVPTPHVRSDKVGRPAAFPSNHGGLALVDLENLDDPGMCISRLT